MKRSLGFEEFPRRDSRGHLSPDLRARRARGGRGQDSGHHRPSQASTPHPPDPVEQPAKGHGRAWRYCGGKNRMKPLAYLQSDGPETYEEAMIVRQAFTADI